MKNESLRLRKHIDEVYEKYMKLYEEFTSIKLSADKWSVKEIFGHLVDSAANNYQRFLRLQETKELEFPGYPYSWVELVKYNGYPYRHLLELWKQFNLLICHIIENLPEDALTNLWKTDDARHTLGFLVKDYIDHLEIHIKQLEDRVLEIKSDSKGGV